MPRSNRKIDEPKSKKTPELQKRRSRPDHDDDDSSVDSHGNLRGLIAYSTSDSSDSETNESSWRETPSSSEAPTPKKRSSKSKPSKKTTEKPEKAEKAEKKEKKTNYYRKHRHDSSDSDSETEESTPPKRRAAAIAEKKIKRRLEKEEEEKAEKAERKANKRRVKPVPVEDTPTPSSSSSSSSSSSASSASSAKEAPKKSKKKVVIEESSEEDEYEDDEDEDEDDEADEEDIDLEDDEEEDEEDYEEEEEEEDSRPQRSSIELLISDLGGGEYQPQKPKKYKLSKEPENVRRFVKLVQTEIDPDEEDIDRDIGYFKGLTPKAQDRLLHKLQTKVEPAEPSVPLKFQIMNKEVPGEVERVALAKYNALINIDPSSTEYYKASQWLHGYTQLPLGTYKDLPVKIEDGTTACQEFVSSVRSHMDSAIYGHDEAKLQILQFVSSWIANPEAAGNVLSIHGPPGVGKTTLIKDGVAKALGRPFHFITLGGATDASFLDGHSYTYEGSTWGRIVDVLIKSKCMNPVIYFDELDKVSETPKGEEINNLLIHLTDGSQNDRFQDKYFTGIDLDLSRCLFIFSHNNHERVNPILRDRMYNIQVDGFGMKEKLIIAESYLVSSALRDANLFEKIGISKEIITHIIEHFTGDEKGVRELKRCIQTVVSKVNLLRFYNDPAKVPFAIKDFALPFTLKRDHIDLFLKKKPVVNESIAHLYM